uniref:Uncharacterized protein n=1 Tax=Arundo donax TaxID=35708 RepID=A0A0A9AR33_ARUDO
MAVLVAFWLFGERRRCGGGRRADTSGRQPRVEEPAGNGRDQPSQGQEA